MGAYATQCDRDQALPRPRVWGSPSTSIPTYPLPLTVPPAWWETLLWKGVPCGVPGLAWHAVGAQCTWREPPAPPGEGAVPCGPLRPPSGGDTRLRPPPASTHLIIHGRLIFEFVEEER